MLSGTHRIVKDLKFTMPHPDDPSLWGTIECEFSGETVNGRAHGMGEFKWIGDCGEGRGMGIFINGLLHGHALVYWYGPCSCEYREGIMNGFGKCYCEDEETGKVNNQEEQDIAGWACYVGNWKGGN